MKVNLVVVRGKPQGKTLGFPCGEFVFGRGDECHVRPNSSWVSRQHCMLRVSEDAVQLRDLGSCNGTLINGKRLMGERTLAHGDQIQIGPLVFQVRLEPGLVETGNFNLDTDVVPILSANQEQTVTAPTLTDDDSKTPPRD